MVPTFIIRKCLQFSFSISVLIFLNLVFLFFPSVDVFTFQYLYCTFFSSKFHLYIISVCRHCLFYRFHFFFIFGEEFDVVNVHKVVDFFSQFMKFVSTCAFPKYVIKWHHSNGDSTSPWKIPLLIFT